MSYINHGSRIFLTGLPNTGMSLSYGDYVLSRKRSEGKMKLHESCSDLRAWSLNSLESSQYFRELTEHVTPSGTIIPFNVIIDHIIGLTSKAQNELHFVKKELQKYKKLELTPRQQEQLRSFENIHRVNDQSVAGPSQNEFRKSVLRNAIYELNKALPHLNPYPERPLKLRPYPLKSAENAPTRKSYASNSKGICTNVELQVEQDVRDFGMQVTEYPLIKLPFDSMRIISVASEPSMEFDVSDSDSGGNLQKDIIIEKDSEIIVLKNDLCVKDAELEELHDENKNLQTRLEAKESTLSSLRESLKACNEEVILIEQRRIRETEDLKQKVSACTALIEELKEDMHKKDQTQCTQVQEIAKLQVYADEAMTLRVQNECLTNKVTELEEQSSRAKADVEQLQIVLRKEEMLMKKQEQEKNCILADQEDQIAHLITITKQISAERDREKKMDQTKTFESCIENLKTVIQNKDIQITEYEKRMSAMQHEVNVFFSNLTKSLNNFDELNQMCDDSHSSTKCVFDVNDEPDCVLYNMNVIMTRFQSYKMEQMQQMEKLRLERQELLHEIKELQNIVNKAEQDYIRESMERQQDGAIPFNVAGYKSRLFVSQNHYSGNKMGGKCSERTRSESYEIEQAFSDIADNTDELEKQIVDQVSCALQKIGSLIQDFRDYAEFEQPELIKRIENVEKVLNDIALVLSSSLNIHSRKKVIAEVYRKLTESNLYREESPRNLPTELRGTVLNIYKSIETILREQLEEMSSVEMKDLSDKQIDDLFKQYLKSCIDRTRGIFESAGRKCSQLESLVKTQEQTIECDIKEINHLKQIIKTYKAQTDRNRNELRTTASELSEKKESMSKLQEKIKVSETKFAKLTKDYMHLRDVNKSLESEKNRWEKECQSKNDKLKNQISEMRSLKSATDNSASILKGQMNKMENSLLSLMFENDVLRTKIVAINEKDETIADLKRSIAKQESLLSAKLIQSQQDISEKQSQIETLMSENEILNGKLREAEQLLTRKVQEIINLHQEKSKVDLIHILQKDIVGSNKNSEKLRTHLNASKRVFLIEQDRCKKLENELNANVRQNESLQKEVQYWKNKNSQLLKQVQQGVVNEGLNRKMRDLSNGLYDRILRLKRVSSDTSEENILLQKEWQQYKNTVETSTSIDYSIFEKTPEKCPWLSDELYAAICSRDEKIKELNTTIKQFENEILEKQNEIDRLFHDVESKDSEINSLKESHNSLIQEKSHLQDVRKNEVDGYQKTIMSMKKNYNSSVHALSAKYKEGIMRLEMRFQDTMNSEKRSFESGAQLQPLEKQPLNIHDLCDFHVSDDGNISLPTKVQTDADVTHSFVEKPEKLNVMHENAEPQEAPNLVAERQRRFAKEIPCNDHPMLPVFAPNYEITIQPQNIKIYQQKNVRLSETNKLVTRDMRYALNTAEKNNLDEQRWTFISRCSLYLKLGNVHQYT